MSEIANKFTKNFENFPQFTLSFSSFNSLNKFIKVHKDPMLARSNVVYKINCLNCEASHIRRPDKKNANKQS